MNNESMEPALKHLVVIPDGNRRWAKENGISAIDAYKKVASNYTYILDTCREKNIRYFTGWVFSTENWKRDQAEVTGLMMLFERLLKEHWSLLKEQKIRFRHLGRKDRISQNLRDIIENIEKETAEFSEYNYQLALDYGGRDEIMRAINNIIADAKEGKVSSMDEELFKQYLDTKDIPDPDLIIRTSGEKRLSGILPFQAVYAELEFVEKYFPAMTKEDLVAIVDSFNSRHRRFGGN
jgi:undecaprenyl diphosphate synthase